MNRRRVAMLLWSMLGLVVLAPQAAAGGGGRCDPDTRAERATGKAAVVELKNACFLPAVLYVERGTEVTFVNRDAFLHNIAGPSATFSFEFTDLNAGDRASFTLPYDGVFPYMCYLHPGMAGAIVVGDGVGAKIGAAAVPPAAGDIEVQAAPSAQSVRAEDGANVVALSGLGIVAALLLASLVVLVRRRSRLSVSGA